MFTVTVGREDSGKSRTRAPLASVFRHPLDRNGFDGRLCSRGQAAKQYETGCKQLTHDEHPMNARKTACNRTGNWLGDLGGRLSSLNATGIAEFCYIISPAERGRTVGLYQHRFLELSGNGFVCLLPLQCLIPTAIGEHRAGALRSSIRSEWPIGG